MKRHSLWVVLSSFALPFSAALIVGCSSDDTLVNVAPDGSTTGDASSKDANVLSDTLPDAQPDANLDATSPDAKTADTGADATAPLRCSAAREQVLKPIDQVSTGEVTVTATEGTVRTLYVDASAGGLPNAPQNPRIYLNLESATRVAVTDRSAETSTDWDLALKREVIFTNSGDGGPGQGSAEFLADQSFETVTAASAQGKAFPPETFFDANCNAILDPNNQVKTLFAEWYAYDPSTHQLTPKTGTWLVRGATGKLFKVQIITYYSAPPGGGVVASAHYSFKVGAL